MTILCTTIRLPYIRDPHRWEEELKKALGSQTILRWCISGMEAGIATVEAVIVVTPEGNSGATGIPLP